MRQRSFSEILACLKCARSFLVHRNDYPVRTGQLKVPVISALNNEQMSLRFIHTQHEHVTQNRQVIRRLKRYLRPAFMNRVKRKKILREFFNSPSTLDMHRLAKKELLVFTFFCSMNDVCRRGAGEVWKYFVKIFVMEGTKSINTRPTLEGTQVCHAVFVFFYS